MQVFAFALNLGQHILIVAHILAVAALIWALTTSEIDSNDSEIFLRMTSVGIGILVYGYIRAVGFSMAEAILNTIDTRRSGFDPIPVIIIPTVLGFAISAMLQIAMKREGKLSLRLCLLAVTFLLLFIADLYISSYSFTSNSGINRYLTPGIIVCASSSLHAILFLNLKQRVS